MGTRVGARPDTWMPWYIGDYAKDTLHLTPEEDGAYRRLIDACWMQNGSIGADDDRLASIARVPPKRWKAIKPTISKFFIVSESTWRHKRVDEELAIALTNMENAGRGGRAKAEKARAEKFARIAAEEAAQIAAQMSAQTSAQSVHSNGAQALLYAGEGEGLRQEVRFSQEGSQYRGNGATQPKVESGEDEIPWEQ